MALFANALASNFSVFSATNTALLQLTTGPGWLRLFRNDFSPTYAASIYAFTEANFPGYTPFNLADVFSTPAKVIDGQFSSSAGPFNFHNTSSLATDVYGFYVSVGPNWLWGGRFIAPYTIPPSGYLPIALTWQGIDLMLALP